MSEKASIVHADGHKDPVAIIGSKIVISLLIGFIVVTLTTVAGVMVLNWRVTAIEDRLERLAQKLDANMDSRWRRSDHDAYARDVERRIRELESRPFPFTEAKSEALTRLSLDVERLREQMAMCMARWAEHESDHKEDGK